MNLNVAICDDDVVFLQQLKESLLAFAFQLDMDLNIDSFQSGDELLSVIQNSNSFPFQIIFLDIEMKEENGINIARRIFHLAPTDLFLSFISSYPEYMQDSFSVHPFSFLGKPLVPKKLIQLMADIRESIRKRHTQIISAFKGDKEAVVYADDIVYISAPDSRLHEMTLYTMNYSYIRRGNLLEMETTFPQLFFRINRNTLISLLHIHYLNDKYVVMDIGLSLPVSVRAKKQLTKYLQSNPVITR